METKKLIVEVRGEIKKLLESNKNENTNLPEPLGYSKGSAERKVYSFECPY
jgi:hypothetical protein